MKIKQIPEDFVVKEITSVKPIGQGDYIWCSLKKRNWDLFKLLKVIADRLQISRSRIGYAGIKDKEALTYQTISFWNVSLQKLKTLDIKDAELNNFEYNQKPIRLGDLKGNWFSITVRDLDKGFNKKFLERKIEELKKNGVLNLFDSQRFGVRNVTHLVGKQIIKADFEKAMILYLTKTNKKDNSKTRRARQLLEETGDLKEALKLFPKSSKWDLAIINHLIANPGDYLGSLKALPKRLQLLFVNAYQSYIWNKCAVEFSKRFPGRQIYLPLVGFNTKFGNSALDKIIKKALNSEKIRAENFKIQGIPELSFSGSQRELLVFPKNLGWLMETDELNQGKNKAVMEFELPKGSYGTHVVKEIFR